MTDEEFKVIEEILNTPGKRPLPVNNYDNNFESSNFKKKYRVVKSKFKMNDNTMHDKKKKKVSIKKVLIALGGVLAIVSSSFVINEFGILTAGEDIAIVDDNIIEKITDNTVVGSKDDGKSQVLVSSQPEVVEQSEVVEQLEEVQQSEVVEQSEEGQQSEVEDQLSGEQSQEEEQASDEYSQSDEEEVLEPSESVDYTDISEYDNIESGKSKVVFEVGTSSDIEDSLVYLNNTIEGYLIRYYSEMYGVDPNLVLAICFQESGGVNLVGEGAANGPMMLEVMGDYVINVYNYSTGGFEEITVSSEHTGDVEYNFKCAIANLRNKIDYFDGNIIAALQAYNYSEYTLDYAFYLNGIVLDGYTDYSWLWVTEDVTNNPQKYGISQLDENGEEIFKKYGVSNYPVYTGRHLPSKIITYNYKNKKITINYETMKVLDVQEIEYHGEKVI